MSTHKSNDSIMPDVTHVEQTMDLTERGDPHRVATDEVPALSSARLTPATLMSIFFLGLSVVAPISCGFIIVTSLLGIIGLDLNGLPQIGWVVSGWSIASSVSFSVAGKLSDIFGRRYVLLAGQLLSIVGSVVAGTAHSAFALIAGSTIIGFSCGMILTIYAGISELVPFKYRGLGLAWSELCLHVPWVVVGILIGRLLATHASWRWCYYIAAIYGAVCLVGSACVYYPPSHPQGDLQKTRWQQVLELDYIGMLLYSAGLSILLLGISWGGQADHPWRSASVLAPIIIGALTFFASFAYCWTIAKQDRAFFPWRLFRKVRQLAVLLIVLLVSGMVYYSMSAILPAATANVFTNDPIQIGIIEIPYGFGQFFGAAIMTSLISWTKHPKWHIVCAVTIQTLFTGLYAYAIQGHKSAWMAFQFFGTGCFAWITISTLVIAGLHVNQADLGVAVGLCGTFRSLGGSIGNAMFGAIIQSELGSQLVKRIGEAAQSIGEGGAQLPDLIAAITAYAEGVPDAFKAFPSTSQADIAVLLAAYQQAWTSAYKIVFLSTVPFGIVALIAALFIEDVTKYMTNHIQVHLEKDVLARQRHGADEKADLAA